MWPTPVVFDCGNGSPGNHYQGLAWIARNTWSMRSEWPTPAARDYRSPNSAASEERRRKKMKNKGAQLVNFVEHQLTSSPLAPTIRSGNESSPSIQRLNPRFVEWVMGWPIGWTAFDSAVTGWFLWLQLMRSSLCSLLQCRPNPTPT